MTMELGTMSHRSSVLSKSLDCALEALTFGDCGSVYLIACSEDVSFDLCTKGVLLSVLKLELSYISLGAYASLLEVALLCFVNTMSVYDLLLAAGILVNNLILLVNEAYLYSTVAIILHGLYLSNHAGTSLKHGYGNEHAIFIEDLSHSNFCCQNCFLHFYLLCST